MPSSKHPNGPKTELAESPDVLELPRACYDETAAVELVESKRWGDCPCCAHCGSVNVYKMMDRKTGERNRRFLWKCRDCRKQYTVRVHAIYSDSPIPMHKWVRATWEACACKNCISALELSRKLQITHKSALWMMHRIRWSMKEQAGHSPKLTGPIHEADETFVGGRPRYRGTVANPITKRGKGTRKQPVLAVLERGGRVRTQVVANVTGDNVKAFLSKHVDFGSRLMTDQESAHGPVGKRLHRHEFVNHGAREYARGDVNTNSVESFFARARRGINGTFHAVSKEHLHRYMDGFAILYNTRRMTDGERAVHLIGCTAGRGLTYSQYRAQAS